MQKIENLNFKKTEDMYDNKFDEEIKSQVPPSMM